MSKKKNRSRSFSPIRQPKHRNSNIYSLCVAGYYDENQDHDKPVRITAIVVDMRTDKVVDRREFLSDTSMETAGDAIIALSIKYDTDISFLDELVSLERCSNCDCGGYVDRMITRKDYLSMLN
jgi:hypothetical protein